MFQIDTWFTDALKDRVGEDLDGFPKNFGRGFFQQLEYFIHVRQKLIYTMNQGYSGVHMVEEVGSLGGGRGI